MKKKIALMLSLLTIMAVMLCGCGTDPTTVDYNGYTYDDLVSEVYNDIGMVQGLSAMLAENGVTVDDLNNHKYASIYDYLISSGVTDAQIQAVTAWNEISAEFGTVSTIDESSFTVDKAGKTLTTDIILVFAAEGGSTRDIVFEVVYDYFSMEVTGISINPVYSMGEKLANAGINTIISMTIVFCVLILISLIIYAFNIFPYLEKRKKEKAKAGTEVSVAAPAEDAVSQIEKRKESRNEVDDTELAAVIAAAIAAGEGTSTSDFVVRSINRR